jgi:hypothetical protein
VKKMRVIVEVDEMLRLDTADFWLQHNYLKSFSR